MNCKAVDEVILELDEIPSRELKMPAPSSTYRFFSASVPPYGNPSFNPALLPSTKLGSPDNPASCGTATTVASFDSSLINDVDVIMSLAG